MSNIGVFDRIVRIMIGVGILSIVFIGPQSPWGWLGLLPLATGLISFCPIYMALGISTCYAHEKCSDIPQEDIPQEEKHEKTISR